MSRTTRSMLALAAAGLAACGGGSGGDASGTLRVALTDAPACGYEHVHVTVDRVRVHAAEDADEDAAGWSEIVLDAPRRIDLLTLANGVLDELGQTALPAGRYRQMRLVLVPNGGAQPLANAVTPTGGAEVALDTPSGSESGLKMNLDVTVGAGERVDLLIDFDACRSVVSRGNSGRYNLKPVLSVLPWPSGPGARVEGWVDPAMAGAEVSVQLDGVPVRSTVPDPADGRFVLWPLPAGDYTLVIAGAGRATGVVRQVPVRDDAPTTVAAAADPISLPDGFAVPVSAGIVASPSTRSALVLARQTLGDGQAIEIIARPLEAGGSVLLPLALSAPWVADWTDAAPGLVFTADDGLGVAGRYTVVARVEPASGALQEQSQAIDVSATVAPLLFSFP